MSAGTSFALFPWVRPGGAGPLTDADHDRRKDPQPLASPYGPHYEHVDEAAGGADSSPLEAMTPEELEQLQRAQQAGRVPKGTTPAGQ